MPPLMELSKKMSSPENIEIIKKTYALIGNVIFHLYLVIVKY